MRRALSTSAAAAAAAPAAEAPVLFARVGALQSVTLNRPAALNALSTEMVGLLGAELRRWRADRGVAAVLLRGAGKAFCAGGDIKVLADAGHPAAQEQFFRSEYELDYALAVNGQAQPHVALFDGAVMGGGVGVSIHAPVRVATERAVFAMPETSIGFYPDVGGSFFLPRLPKRFGHFLGLTGERLKGAELVAAGVATHFVPAAGLPAFEADLAAAVDAAAAAAADTGRALSPAEALEAVTAAADRHATPQSRLPPFPLTAEALALIDWAFGQPTVEGVVEALSAHVGVTPGAAAGAPPPARGSAQEVARRCLATLARVSPTALKVTHEQLRRGAGLGLADCLAQELRMSLRMARQPDFPEGVRALLVDRDNAPRWSPAALAQVTDAQVQAVFAPLEPGAELRLQ